MSAAIAASPLSEEQMAFFHDEGYLVVPHLFCESDLRPVIDEITAEIDHRAAALCKTGELSRLYAEEPFEMRMARICEETRKIQRAITNGNLHGAAFFDLITHPKLLDVAEQICGDELVASSAYRLRVKAPGDIICEVPWHQDAGYFDAACDVGLVLTVWIALVDACEENGCLWVLPRKHQERHVWRHEYRPEHTALELPECELSKDGRVCCPIPKGGALLMTNFTPHASFANRTNAMRWSMDLRYQNASLPTNADIGVFDDANRNADESGNPIACYAPEKDFLVRSRKHPAQVIHTSEQFAELRANHPHLPHPNRFGVLPG